MNCPVCRARMEEGYFQCLTRAAWLKKPRKASLLPKAGEILLENHAVGDCVFRASLCRKCRKIVVDYADKEIEEGGA